LLPDVGWALIDYIKKGRPATNEKTIFVRHNPPFCKLTDETSLHFIINRQIQLAGINIENQKKGLHSLRHTLATLLFESNIPIEDITSILGHKSSNSTPTYIKTSINMLKTCCNDDELI
jgi:site-specific recombinase XerD